MLDLVAEVARRVIENGGETYRAEQLLARTAGAAGMKSCHSFVTPTGIMASGDDADGQKSIVRRIERRGINLGEICRIESLVRNLESGSLPLDAFKTALRRETPPRRFTLAIRVLASSWIAACFALLFGGGSNEFGFALAIGPIITFSGILLDRAGIPPYFERMGNSALVVFLAMAAVAVRPGVDLGSLTSGPLMLLVPGIAITNSVRDTIEGDLVAGLSRGLEAFLLAAALAVGAGFALKCGDLIARFAA